MDREEIKFFLGGDMKFLLMVAAAKYACLWWWSMDVKISQNVANIPEVFLNYLLKVSDIHAQNTRYASNHV